jgi:hypothetical protein
MSLALRSGKAYPRDAEKDGAPGSPTVWTKVGTDPVTQRSYSDIVRSGSPSLDNESGRGDGVIYCRRPRVVSESNVGHNEGSIETPCLSWDAETNAEIDAQWKKVGGK